MAPRLLRFFFLSLEVVTVVPQSKFSNVAEPTEAFIKDHSKATSQRYRL